VIDQMGRSVEVPSHPRRIVSLVPSQTELLFDLGLDDEIVGVTRFCVHPADRVAAKTVIGGTKTIDIAAVDALQPDLIVGSKEENDRETIERLAASHTVWMSDVSDLVGALEMIRAVGRLVGKPDAAGGLADRIEGAFAAVRPASPPRQAAYVIWQRPYLVAGEATFIGDLLSRCGLVNAFDGRYPEVTIDDLRDAALDVLLLSTEPYPFTLHHRDAMARRLAGVAVHLVDGRYFSWYGSRLLHAAEYCRELIDRLCAAGRPRQDPGP
jgi:ABC-type Fe3+-hydroxamate transport system substrate-binding protein